MSIREKVKLQVYKRWYDQVDLETAKSVHRENVAAIQAAQEKRKDPNRPFHIVGIVGSSRNRTNSCANEMSNSMLMMEKAGRYYNSELNVTFEIVDLADKFIEPCNGCYSSAGSLCRFSCDCVSTQEPILTENGWVILDELSNSSPRVLDGKGYWHAPLQYLDKGERECVQVETVEGYKITVTPDHELFLQPSTRRCIKSDATVQAKDLKPGDLIQLALPDEPCFPKTLDLPFDISKINNYRPANGGCNFNTPNYSQQWSEELGEALGFLLANGYISTNETSKGVSLSGDFSDEDDMKRVMDYLGHISGGNVRKDVRCVPTTVNGRHYLNETLNFHLSSTTLIMLLDYLGMDKSLDADQRGIPTSLWKAPQCAVKGFLKGLIAADGSAFFQEGRDTARVNLYSVSQRLLEEVQLLLLQFGIRSCVYEPPKTLCEDGTPRNVWYLSISAQGSVKLFRDRIGSSYKRKQKVLDEHVTRRDQPRYAKVKCVKPAGKKKVADISMPIEHSFCAAGLRVHNCFPLDDMQPIYAKLTLADGMLFSTGVNENMPSSRMKLMIDRLISMDGGRFAPEYNVEGKTWKDTNAKLGEMRVSQEGEFTYVQRLSGKVVGALVAAKDYGAYKVGWDMLQAFNDYGCLIPSNAVAYWHSPRVAKDTAFDKSDLIQELENGFIGNLCTETARKVLALARLVRGQDSVFAEKMTGRT